MKKIAIILVLTMAGYFVVTNHVSLRPFNNLSPERPQLMSTVVGTLPALLVVLALALQSYVATCFLFGSVGGPGYLTGADVGHRRTPLSPG